MTALDWTVDNENPDISRAHIGTMAVDYVASKNMLVLSIAIVSWAIKEVPSREAAEDLARRTAFFGARL